MRNRPLHLPRPRITRQRCIFGQSLPIYISLARKLCVHRARMQLMMMMMMIRCDAKQKPRPAAIFHKYNVVCFSTRYM